MEKTVALIFGRLNPPTIGHLKLIDTLANQDATDHLIYLSHSYDPKKNPLKYEDKIQFVDAIISPKYPHVDIVESDARNIVEILSELSGEYSRAILVAGGDRIAEFETLVNRYNGQPDKLGNILYSFSEIRVVSAGERDPDADDVSGMSASKVRARAQLGDFKGFAAAIPTNDHTILQQIYKAVRTGMKLTEAGNDLKKEFFNHPEIKKLSPEAQNNAFIEYAKLYKENPKVTIDEFIKSKTETPEANKEKTEALIQEVEAVIKSKTDAANGYFNNIPPKMTLPTVPIQGITKARVLITLAEPPTNEHSTAIMKMLKPQNGVALVLAVIESNSSSSIINSVRLKAIWAQRLLLAQTPHIYFCFGKAGELGKLLAPVFQTVSVVGQPKLVDSALGGIGTGWYATGKAQNSITGDNSVRLVCDSPNAAVTALSEFRKQDKKTAQEAMTAQQASTEKDDPKQKLLRYADAERLAFTKQLPQIDTEEFRNHVYYAFLPQYNKFAGTSTIGKAGDWMDYIWGTKTGQAFKALGSEVGVTQIVSGVNSLAKQAAKIGKTPVLSSGASADQRE